MKSSVIILCVVVLAGVARPQVRTPESLTDEQLAQIIQRVQQTPASRLDSALPTMGFAEWLEMEAGQGAKIGWALRYPDVDSGEARREVPTCVEADAIMKNGWSINIFIAVGTRGMVGNHKVFVFKVGLMKQREIMSLGHLRELSSALRSLEKDDLEAVQ
jgi:hypothetical protein